MPATDWAIPVTDLRSALRLFTTVRLRSALIAAAVIAAAMVVGSLILLSLYRNQLEVNLDGTLQQQANDRVALLDQGTDPTSLVTVLQEEAMVWIGTPVGEAVAVGGAIVPIDNPVPAVVGQVATSELLVEERKPDEIERERMNLRIASAATTDGRLVVLAGSETEQIDEALSGLAKLFAVAVPVLALLVGGLTWLLAGRVLDPVEQIRAQAERIGAQTLEARVPVPEAKDEIHALAITMNSMLDRVESHEQSLRQFSADASHELKSPIANVRALTDTASIDDPAWPSLRSRLVGETERLGGLVDNLLFLASQQDGGSTAHTPVDLDELVFDEAELLSATDRVAVDLTGVGPVQVSGTDGDLRRLIRNLADNAARHAATRVKFSTGNSAGAVVLRVEDDGAGIKESDRDRIFERFTRLDEARARDDGGSGLGLAIVRQIADDHRATIQVGSSPLGGAYFAVTFDQS